MVWRNFIIKNKRTTRCDEYEIINVNEKYVNELFMWNEKHAKYEAGSSFNHYIL